MAKPVDGLWLIDGLTLSNNVTDANNDIDIAVGLCSVTDGLGNFDVANLLLPITKRLDAAWTVGTNQGGIDAGSKANSTWYHVHLIKNPTSGVVDALFSTSLTPTMPTGYTLRRRIGSVLTNGSGNIVAFQQSNNSFVWLVANGFTDYDNVSVGASFTSLTLTCPQVPGVRADLEPSIRASSTVTKTMAFSFDGVIVWADILRSGANNQFQSCVFNMLTNSGVIYHRITASGSLSTYRIRTLGWIDPLR